MTSAVLEVVDLSKTFPGRRGHKPVKAVESVSFHVEAGESLAIVGESGSGKSTVARMLVGLETPSEGIIRVGGVERRGGRISAKERRQRARQIQMVFQDPYSSLDRLQTVARILRDALRVSSDGDVAEARIDELLDSVGMQRRHATMHPGQLSGGQRQRVAIARALAVRPQVLVLDEAVAALDVSIQAQVLNLLKELRERTGTAFLFISHDLAVVNQISERCLVMSRGRVVEEGATRHVLASPQTDYTKVLRDAVPRPGWRPHHLLAGGGSRGEGA